MLMLLGYTAAQHNMKSWVSLVAQKGWGNREVEPFFGDHGDITVFTQEYQEYYDSVDNKCHICFFSCNHDYKRPITDRPVNRFIPI